MLRIHCLQTGTIAIKRAHYRLSGLAATRFPAILLDRTYTDPLPTYAWLIEHPEGLILVDTGESARASSPEYFDCDSGYRVLMRGTGFFRIAIRPEEQTAAQLIALGFDPAGIRQVVLTHLHSDHVGGVPDFARAEFLVGAKEPGHPYGTFTCHFPAGLKMRLISCTERPVGAFPWSYPLTKTGDVYLIPTPGHTPGHHSVLVLTPEADYLLAGDTSFTEEQLLTNEIGGIVADVGQTRSTLALIREYAAQRPLVYLPTHDPNSKTRLAGSVPLTI